MKLALAGVLAFIVFKLFRKPGSVEGDKAEQVDAVETVQDPINGVLLEKTQSSR